MNTDKKVYRTPQLDELGAVADLTSGAFTGKTDKGGKTNKDPK